MRSVRFFPNRRCSQIISICFLFTLAVTSPTLSAERSGADNRSTASVDAGLSGPISGAESAVSPNNDTQVITDKKAHVVRVLIAGKEILTVDAGGVHVHGNIAYSGVSTAGGTSHEK